MTYHGVGLVGYIAVSLPIDKLGLSLIDIKALAVPVIALAVWAAIRRVKDAVAKAAQRGK